MLLVHARTVGFDVDIIRGEPADRLWGRTDRAGMGGQLGVQPTWEGQVATESPIRSAFAWMPR
jgi:hypothetical protein